MSCKCPVCMTDNTIETPTGLVSRYSCRRCGEFTLGFPASDLPCIVGNDVAKTCALSHWIRGEYNALCKEPPDARGFRRGVYLTDELVRKIIQESRPPLAEQADNYVRWIGDNVKIGGQYVPVEELAIQAIVGAATIKEFELVSTHLRDSGLIDHSSETGVWRKVTLTFAGWERYRELKQPTSDSRKAFMAMQYNEAELDSVVEKVFKPAVRQTGFDLFRLVDGPQPAGLIDDRLRVAIQMSRFVIADLTHENRGAYWEAGYAEGLGKPVIYTCEETKFETLQTHFDTNHHLTIKWDADKPSCAAEELKATIRATLPAEAKLTDD